MPVANRGWKMPPQARGPLRSDDMAANTRVIYQLVAPSLPRTALQNTPTDRAYLQRGRFGGVALVQIALLQSAQLPRQGRAWPGRRGARNQWRNPAPTVARSLRCRKSPNSSLSRCARINHLGPPDAPSSRLNSSADQPSLAILRGGFLAHVDRQGLSHCAPPLANARST